MILGDGNYKKDINLFKNIFRNKIILPGFIDIKEYQIIIQYQIYSLFYLLMTLHQRL